MNNYQIRRSIESYIHSNGKQDTRTIIARWAKRLGVPKQKISGNLRCMIYDEHSVSLTANKPHSIIY